MNEQLEELKRIYALPEDRCAHIEENIIRNYTHRKYPVANPTLILIGAQPGAGKTSLLKLTMNELQLNAAICDPDNFRKFHPLAGKILRRHEKFYSDLTQEVASRWNHNLIPYCLNNKLNYIHESTFPGDDYINNCLKRGKTNGFSSDVKILAVNSRLSMLGAQLRYEEMKRQRGVGRSVAKEYHDLRYFGLPFTIQSVQEAKEYTNLNIYARNVIMDGPSLIEEVILIARNPADPQSIYLNEVHRYWQPKLLEYFRQKCDYVLSLMEARNASQEEINDFKISVSLTENVRKLAAAPLITTQTGISINS